LPEENQDKDREKVRSISVILARAGFKIAPSTGGQPDEAADSGPGKVVDLEAHGR
jgi:hypothetical protein